GFIGKGEERLQALEELLPKIRLKFVPNAEKGFSEMYLDGENVEEEIRQMEVSEHVSRIAELEQVRLKLVELQKAMGRDKGIVMDGRDIGTTVFPDAELKVFMTASAQARATRRYKELLDKGEKVTYDEVYENIEKRDYIDTHREFSPLKKADDAIEFDNSDMGLREQFERLESIARRCIART
ncbi:MAG: (d)CMP kinase, partial [Pricia sp.]